MSNLQLKKKSNIFLLGKYVFHSIGDLVNTLTFV